MSELENYQFTDAINAQDVATNKVSAILMSLDSINQCGSARQVIDLYAKQFPNNKEFIAFARDYLCDKTFELYAKDHKKSCWIKSLKNSN